MAPVEFSLKLAWAGTPPAERFYRYRYTEAERDRADVKVNPQPEFSPAPGSAAWLDDLPPNSVTIYSTYKLNHDDPGSWWTMPGIGGTEPSDRETSGTKRKVV